MSLAPENKNKILFVSYCNILRKKEETEKLLKMKKKKSLYIK